MLFDDAAWTKLALLAKGVTCSQDFSEWFAKKETFVVRRNFYNTPVWHYSNSASLPQEIKLGSVVVAVNTYGDSPWELAIEEDQPVLRNTRADRTFGIQMLVDLDSIRQNENIAKVCNLYGGSALSFFSPRACYFFADGTECRFCSLGGTAQESHDYAARLTPYQVKEAVSVVLDQESHRVNQVMIVGGNERNLDSGFKHHLDLVSAAYGEIKARNLEDRISIHLATMPPKDLDLIDRLSGLGDIHVMFNLEVWWEDSFLRVVPGKAQDYGRNSILLALERLCSAIGQYKAHSILIAGLEPTSATLEGASALVDMGVSPIINAYHSDRYSRIGLSVRPSYLQLAEIAHGLQRIHDSYPIEPYWRGCGRNSIDFEASLGMFRSEIPEWLEHQ